MWTDLGIRSINFSENEYLAIKCRTCMDWFKPVVVVYYKFDGCRTLKLSQKAGVKCPGCGDVTEVEIDFQERKPENEEDILTIEKVGAY